MIFRLVVPFANRLANLRLADGPGQFANWPDWQIGRNTDLQQHQCVETINPDNQTTADPTSRVQCYQHIEGMQQ